MSPSKYFPMFHFPFYEAEVGVILYFWNQSEIIFGTYSDQYIPSFIQGTRSSWSIEENRLNIIYLLTAIGLSPGGRSTVHIYTQTIHRTIRNKQYIEQHNNFGRVRAVPRFA